LILLIFGGTGLIGSTLARHALQNHKVFITTNETPNLLQNVKSEKLNFEKDTSRIEMLIKSVNPDYVVNTVGHPSVEICETDKQVANFLHVDIVKDIVNYCKEGGCKLIQFSTDYVFDGNVQRNYTEDDTPNPINHYGKTRLLAEQIVNNASQNNVVLRTSVVYGWHEKSRFTNWIIQSLQQNKTVDTFSDQYNTPTLVDDLVNAILKVIETKASGLFHAAGKTCINRYEFAKAISESFHLDHKLIKPVTKKEKKQVAPRPVKPCLDSNKLECLIEFDFSTINQGLNFVFNQSKASKPNL